MYLANPVIFIENSVIFKINPVTFIAYLVINLANLVIFLAHPVIDHTNWEANCCTVVFYTWPKLLTFKGCYLASGCFISSPALL